jgi:phosphoheptose isomerase
VIGPSFDEHERVLRAGRSALEAAVEQAASLVGEALARGGKVLAFGNGGSAADAQHLASELVGRFGADRPGWRALALTVDSSTLTSVANDFGFDQVFARQVEALADDGDVVVALSTSGRSANVLAGVRSARALGCSVVALTGEGAEELGALSDVHLEVPSRTVPRIQEVHGLCLHALVAQMEARRGDGAPS